MKKKERGMPEIVFIGPPERRARFKQTVFLVEERKDGVPHKLRMIRDDETITVEEGMEFMTGYVLEFMTRPKE
jgi:hypothetical protein